MYHGNNTELSNMAERKEKLVGLIKELPESNQRTLHFLMTFLKALSLRSEVNKMSTLNLGVVFAPTILRRKVETKVPPLYARPKLAEETIFNLCLGA